MATKEQIQVAVNNPEWQKFRKSLKGLPTETKVRRLRDYYELADTHYFESMFGTHAVESCNVCIRVDNYVKALCRGGQLNAGQSLDTMLKRDWKAQIKKA